MISWRTQAMLYIIELNNKNSYDEGFYIEFYFICYEIYKFKHPEARTEIDYIQKEMLNAKTKYK